MANTIIESDIYKGFSGDWQQRGGEHYVARESAEDFVAYVGELGITVLGIEGIVLHHNTTMPVINTIADYSAGAPTVDDITSYLKTTSHLVTHFCFVLNAA